MTDEKREQVRDLFDGVAGTYDAVGVEFFKPIAQRLVAELAPRPGEGALDVGCGRGAVLFPLAAAVGPAGRVVGIDLSPQMVQATAADVTAAGLSTEVIVGDAQHPDLSGQSFDIVASSLVLFFLPDPVAALTVWRELLVPGGRVGVSTFGELTPSWHDVDAVFAPYLPNDLPDPRTQLARSPFGSDAGMEDMLVDAGYADVRTVSDAVSVRFDDEDQWYRWTWSVGQRRMWQLVPESERDDVRAQAHERLDRTRDADGRIGFDQGVRYTLGSAPLNER
jgi:ubiquinone/menaquinone biosynthesis C-methylase UbiE